MAHPRMYTDGEPYLQRVRGLALALPEAREVESHGRPTFRAGRGKIFAVLGSHTVDSTALIIKPDPAERPALSEDPRFSVPPYYGPSGWLALELADIGLTSTDGWAEVRELLIDSYRQVAIGRQLKALDAQT